MAAGRRTFAGFAGILCAAGLLHAGDSGADRWQAFEMLMGEWVGEGGGEPGQGSGAFSLRPELQGRILVRRNKADYPATPGQRAFTHDDLMIVYQDEQSGLRADYFDNEGHIIRYAVTADAGAIRFVSDATPSGPGFRLTYSRAPEGKLKIVFEMAPPGKPGAFRPYLEATARRAG